MRRDFSSCAFLRDLHFVIKDGLETGYERLLDSRCLVKERFSSTA